MLHLGYTLINLNKPLFEIIELKQNSVRSMIWIFFNFQVFIIFSKNTLSCPTLEITCNNRKVARHSFYEHIRESFYLGCIEEIIRNIQVLENISLCSEKYYIFLQSGLRNHFLQPIPFHSISYNEPYKIMFSRSIEPLKCSNDDFMVFLPFQTTCGYKDLLALCLLQNPVLSGLFSFLFYFRHRNRIIESNNTIN